MSRPTTRYGARRNRHLRVRVRVIGSIERPRLSVFRSLRHVYAQVINDTDGCTMVAASSLGAIGTGASSGLNKTKSAQLVGTEVARQAMAAGVTRVVFDRGGYKYHGRIKALADAAREGGLDF